VRDGVEIMVDEKSGQVLIVATMGALHTVLACEAIQARAIATALHDAANRSDRMVLVPPPGIVVGH
jgi:hypothetical protein